VAQNGGQVNARNGVPLGGSGFITGIRANVPSVREYYFRYAVTNAHVIRDGFPVVRLNLSDGRVGILNFETKNWISHPYGDDVAVHPFSHDQDDIHFMIIPFESFITREMIIEYDIGIGDEAFLVGAS
jgi:hypothetical protein